MAYTLTEADKYAQNQLLSGVVETIVRDSPVLGSLPFIEVHLSNVHAREPFRRHSYFSDIAVGHVVGLGALGYELAIRAAAARLSQPAAKA